ncbi:hypothetical protein, partial [Enterococcus faecium]|uniref:hypothetical protein n=1 Tax=Enterococcus faecium TaxID=1352 RepID=UPI0021E7CB07
TKVLTEEVNAFKVRTLNDKYVAIFMIPSVFQMIYHSKKQYERCSGIPSLMAYKLVLGIVDVLDLSRNKRAAA